MSRRSWEGWEKGVSLTPPGAGIISQRGENNSAIVCGSILYMAIKGRGSGLKKALLSFFSGLLGCMGGGKAKSGKKRPTEEGASPLRVGCCCALAASAQGALLAA